VLRLCFESDGYRVVLARDGQHALACIGAVPATLILLDLNEPTVAEWALLAQLREGAKAAVVTLTWAVR
jgi:DNA-binding response OmpR family regulator